MESSAKPASPSGDFHKLRAEFASLNPDLRAEPSQYHCRELWHLLTPRHRHSLPNCYPGAPQAWESDCFLSNSEVWRDTLTGLPVLVLHLYCKHHSGATFHEQSLSVLAERGLWYATSNASWMVKKARLVVIGRADVIDRITLPNLLDNNYFICGFEWDISAFPEGRRPEIHWERCEELRLTEERRVRAWKARLGAEAESRGDYQAALECYCETAFIDRAGVFYQSAAESLGRARGVIEAHPGLDVGALRFENIRDMEYVFYNARRMVSPSHLEHRLMNVSLPVDWKPFVSSTPWDATARISGHGRSGEASIDQLGKGELWIANVQLNDGPLITTVAGEEPQDKFGEESYCCESPEAAAEAAKFIYHNYGRLLINEGVPLAKVIELSGVLRDSRPSQ